MGNFNTCCIVDDDDFFVFNTKRIMKDTGFCDNIISYGNGQEAIDGLIGLLVENIPLPEIIILDLNMPKKNGWEFLEEFVKIPESKIQNCDIYVASSFISPENIAKSKKYEVVKDYVLKPISDDSLDLILSSRRVF
ncbi:response regulator [Maribacter sp. 2210JD10-5]|uniref:response regulator n=1 Tax=Maribacter sp. 2210JD10-5 TaxID=3386272 RepID=UPI0039BD53A0